MNHDGLGQQLALPLEPVLDDDYEEDAISHQVQQYLMSVRQEAENDEISFMRQTQVKNGSDEPKRAVEVATVEEYHEGSFGHDWAQTVVDRLVSLKGLVNVGDMINEADEFQEIEMTVPTTAASWRKYVMENEPPSIAFLYQIDRDTVFKLIIYCTKWLSTSTNENLSKWIWYCFIRVDNLLEANETSLVRDLAKKAIKLTQKLDDATEMARYTIAMIILVVGVYYGQKDLLESLNRLQTEG